MYMHCKGSAVLLTETKINSFSMYFPTQEYLIGGLNVV